ncbi:MAG: hypothetical protein KBG48_09345 [Kofleriaceae bacterium]|jgi:hypothetical protein|nr:hypothetical protein [Kofleriaceae bacterium]MBP9167581.1 hypothetical protein [Kofleriaceae bacterium]MBP9856663.1 hypothetical protein [Kofleriaceae bacterium]
MRAAAIALTFGLAACGGDALAPSTLITEARLLAVAASPPVTTLDGEAELRALVVAADGAPADVAVTWRACSPWRVLRDPDLDCAPGDALPLAVDADGAARLRVEDVLARFGGPGAPPPPPGACPGPVVPIPVIATATVDGTRLVARKDVGVGAAARRAPVIAAITLDDQPAASFTPGAVYRLAAVPALDSLDATCTDDPEPVAVREGVRTYFYVSAGGLDEVAADVSYQPDDTAAIGSVEFTAPDDAAPVRLWSVMLDGDGGAAWTLRTLDAK